jgi:hypothetical protein
MGKVAVKPKSRILFETLTDKGMKKKKAAKIANGFVVTKRGDTSASRPSSKAKSSKSNGKAATRRKTASGRRARSRSR